MQQQQQQQQQQAITCQTVRLDFSEPIGEFDALLSDNPTWGILSLKALIEGYGNTRFIPTGEQTAIVTSEHNMQFVTEWIKRHFFGYSHCHHPIER